MTNLHPVGFARTPFPSPRGIPRQGAGPASIEILPAFAPALDGIAHCSHLWVLAWLDEAPRELLAQPRKTAPDGPPRGVFSMRSPVRPNPIALTSARLLRVDNNVLHLDRLDLRDGTAIVDLKPYSPGWDLIPSATSTHRYDPSRYTEQELVDAIGRDALHAAGPHALDNPSVAGLVDLLVSLTRQGVDVRAASTRFAIGHADARVEVLLCATGATFGNQRLELIGLPEADDKSAVRVVHL